MGSGKLHMPYRANYLVDKDLKNILQYTQMLDVGIFAGCIFG
jgi:hypothetical protein